HRGDFHAPSGGQFNERSVCVAAPGNLLAAGAPQRFENIHGGAGGTFSGAVLGWGRCRGVCEGCGNDLSQVLAGARLRARHSFPAPPRETNAGPKQAIPNGPPLYTPGEKEPRFTSRICVTRGVPAPCDAIAGALGRTVHVRTALLFRI